VSAVDWLVSQPWPVLLALYLSPLALLTGLLITFARHRDPPEPERDWHVHTDDCPGRDKCICEDGTIYACRAHKGQAAAVLHQEAP
jgi:hypothetical protein